MPFPSVVKYRLIVFSLKIVRIIITTLIKLPIIVNAHQTMEKGMATPSSILARRIPWMEEPGWATVHGVSKSQT